MATITPVKVTYAGTARGAGTTLSTTDKFENNGRTIISVVNSGAEMNVVVKNQQLARPGKAVTVLDQTITIPASRTVDAGPFEPGWFNDEEGYVVITASRTSDTKIHIEDIS